MRHQSPLHFCDRWLFDSGHDFDFLLYYSTHRQRTQNYIKTLESEVIRLRGSEQNLMQEKERLQAQIDTLKTTLILSEVPLPPGFEESPVDPAQAFGSAIPDMPATVSYRTDDSAHQRLHVNWPSISSQETYSSNFRSPNHPQNLPDGTYFQGYVY